MLNSLIDDELKKMPSFVSVCSFTGKPIIFVSFLGVEKSALLY